MGSPTPLAPMLSRFWDDPESWTMETYRRNDGYQALDKALKMDPDAVIVRHKVAGVPKRIADALAAPVINAGDGAHEHPTQALLDTLG